MYTKELESEIKAIVEDVESSPLTATVPVDLDENED